MQVEIKLDPSATEPKLIVLTDHMTEELNEIICRITSPDPQMIAGFRDEMVRILDQDEIIRIYAFNGKVLAKTEDGAYTLRHRLYELENRLRKDRFVRISHSEIINMKKVRRFDLSTVGTICVSFSDHSTSYVSRDMFPESKRYWDCEVLQHEEKNLSALSAWRSHRCGNLSDYSDHPFLCNG